MINPKLRFLNDNGENYPDWEEIILKEKFIITRGKVLSKNELENQNQNNYPVYSSQTKNRGVIGYYSKYLYENAITWTTDGANAGDVNYRENKFYCTNVCGVILEDICKPNNFIAHALNRVTEKYISNSGIPKLMNNIMENIRINTPRSLEEQQKIGEFFKTFDELIELKEQLIKAKEQYKKAMLQKIFNQELIFLNEKGKRYPDWEVKRLGDITDVSDGTHESPNILDTGIPFITSKNIIAGKLDYANISYISEEDHLNFKKRSSVENGDILMSMIGTVGNVCIVSKSFEFSVKNVGLIRKNKNYNRYYVLSYLQSQKGKKEIEFSKSGGIQKFISLGKLRSLNINIPESLEEQKKIGNFFKTLEEEIELLKEQLKQLKYKKKYYQSVMF